MSNETKILIGISVVTIAIVVGAAVLIGGKSDAKPQDNTPVKNKEALVRSDSHIEQNKGAKVTIVEFGDFQCPACGVAFPTVEKVRQEYHGRINFVFRNFPLPMHPNAKSAAEAVEAAGAQGKFFEMYELLYTHQDKWGESKSPMDAYLQYAKELKLDVDTFKSDVTGNKYASKIQKDLDDGNAVGVNATPTFFINGVKQEGGLQYDDFKTKIDAALKK